VPRDEREALIQWRAQSLGYYVLMVLALALFVPVHLGHTAIDMANFALLDVVIATLVVAVAQIVMFRRGA
jgi:formate hydrogenlyase subunit 4